MSDWIRHGLVGLDGTGAERAFGERSRAFTPGSRTLRQAGRLLSRRSAAQVAVGGCAVLLGAMVWHTLLDDYGVRNVTAGTLGLATAIAIALCRLWPVAAWWLSLGSAVLAAVVSRPELEGMVWPNPVLAAHVGVLGLAAFRARHRMLVQMWVVTLVAGVMLWALLPGEQTVVSLVDMSLLSGMVLITVGALGGRRRALHRAALADRQTRAEQARSALLEERSRIARELHDVVAHHMSVVAVQAEAAPYRVPDPPEELTSSFATIRASAIEALNELHRVLGLLRDDTPYDASPPPGLDRLDELAARMRETGMRVRLRVDGDRRPLPPGVELSAYRIVQEALSNALQHAPGTGVHIAVTYEPDRLRLRMENGPATGPPRTSGRPGHGLLGMRERVAMLGGEFEAGPRPDGGYAVTVLLPLKEGM
ncbi:sensor histidine kinase [Nonomuraea sp. NPDC049480]|uniref:sensor histidine kinase n=1 Tax=Nonomuraea sp. NPDC049480 TaxID=3364353 RepID=UPI00378A7B4D